MKPGFDFYYKQKEIPLPTSCDLNPESIINSQSGIFNNLALELGQKNKCNSIISRAGFGLFA